MKFTVEVEEFWIEEGELSLELKKSIHHTVITQIQASIKELVNRQLTEKIEAEMKERLSILIESTLIDISAKQVITKNGQDISIPEHVRKMYQENSGWSRPDDVIKDLVKKLGQDLKNRYDLLFATQLVVKLNEQGMLKEDVARILLDGNKTSTPPRPLCGQDIVGAGDFKSKSKNRDIKNIKRSCQ